MELLNKSNVTFNRGAALSSVDLNSVVNTQNNIIDTVNKLLKSFCDINQEENTQNAFSLEEAISKVPESRRSFTMKIRFIENADMNTDGTLNIRFAEYFYTGPKEFNDKEWGNIENWSRNVPSIIDGGEW